MKKVRAHTNIALIKYWGKKNEEYKIPYNSSLSLTLDQFYTETSVEYKENLNADRLFIDEKEIVGKDLIRVQKYMDVIRNRYGINEYAIIRSENFVPSAAGLASSASAFAALAKASTLHLDLDDKEISRLARLGSGSASRSIYPGFAKWHRGTDHESSFAEPIEMESWDELRMLVCMVNDKKKPFLSSEAMKETVQKSAYYSSWVEQSEKDFIKAEEYIKNHDLDKLGPLIQENALRMHASLMAINKWYFEPDTIKIMNRVREMQQEIPVYFTMDAGPNVKLLTTKSHVDTIKEKLKEFEIIVCKAGKGIKVI
ncbi:MAG TPA: diphosphomevalonate decarboxylase [Erysipelothrix sp.]